MNQQAWGREGGLAWLELRGRSVGERWGRSTGPCDPEESLGGMNRGRTWSCIRKSNCSGWRIGRVLREPERSSYLPGGIFRWDLANFRPRWNSHHRWPQELTGIGETEPHQAPSITQVRQNSNKGPRRIWGPLNWAWKQEKDFMSREGRAGCSR